MDAAPVGTRPTSGGCSGARALEPPPVRHATGLGAVRNDPVAAERGCGAHPASSPVGRDLSLLGPRIARQVLCRAASRRLRTQRRRRAAQRPSAKSLRGERPPRRASRQARRSARAREGQQHAGHPTRRIPARSYKRPDNERARRRQPVQHRIDHEWVLPLSQASDPGTPGEPVAAEAPLPVLDRLVEAPLRAKRDHRPRQPGALERRVDRSEQLAEPLIGSVGIVGGERVAENAALSGRLARRQMARQPGNGDSKLGLQHDRAGAAGADSSSEWSSGSVRERQ